MSILTAQCVFCQLAKYAKCNNWNVFGRHFDSQYGGYFVLKKSEKKNVCGVNYTRDNTPHIFIKIQKNIALTICGNIAYDDEHNEVNIPIDDEIFPTVKCQNICSILEKKKDHSLDDIICAINAKVPCAQNCQDRIEENNNCQLTAAQSETLSCICALLAAAGRQAGV